jgi:hypothetical protein
MNEVEVTLRGAFRKVPVMAMRSAMMGTMHLPSGGGNRNGGGKTKCVTEAQGQRALP